MKITKLVAGKKNPQKINVYIDDKYAFNIDALEIASNKLYTDKEITKEEINKLKASSDTAKLYEYCLRVLNIRPRSESELRFMIKRITARWNKTYSAEKIDSTISKLKDKKYLDDEAFAKWWIESRTEFKPRGKYALRQELRIKGIDRELIEDSIKKYYPEENEEEYIYKLALKKYKLLEKEEENKRKQKTLAYLLRKGFEYDKIASVLTKLENEQNKK